MANTYNWSKHKAIERQFNNTVGADIPEKPGIYLWTRYDSDINKTYFYIGQAVNLKNRRFDYHKVKTGLKWPEGHFQRSLKAHNDWQYQIQEFCTKDQLDEREKYWIHFYKCKDNYITRNTQHGDVDITRTNANRIDRIKKEYEKSVAKDINNLDILDEGFRLSFIIKFNKDNSANKKSVDSMANLKMRLGINEINKV